MDDFRDKRIEGHLMAIREIMNTREYVASLRAGEMVSDTDLQHYVAHDAGIARRRMREHARANSESYNGLALICVKARRPEDGRHVEMYFKPAESDRGQALRTPEFPYKKESILEALEYRPSAPMERRLKRPKAGKQTEERLREQILGYAMARWEKELADATAEIEYQGITAYRREKGLAPGKRGDGAVNWQHLYDKLYQGTGLLIASHRGTPVAAYDPARLREFNERMMDLRTYRFDLK